MANLRLLYDNLFSQAALTPSSEDASYPAENLQNTDRTLEFVSASVAVAVTLEMDLGLATSLTGVAVVDPTLFSGGGLELYERGSSGSPGAATLVATLSTADAGTGVAYAFFTSTNKRHWQLKWTNPGLVTSTVGAGYVAAGAYYELTQNASGPIPWDLNDGSTHSWSVDGQKTSVSRPLYLSGEFRVTTATITDRTTLVDTIYRTVGQHTPFVAVVSTSLAWTAIYQRFATGISAEIMEARDGNYELSWAWEEER